MAWSASAAVRTHRDQSKGPKATDDVAVIGDSITAYSEAALRDAIGPTYKVTFRARGAYRVGDMEPYAIELSTTKPEQVVINLLVNAMDAVTCSAGARGRIRIETRALPDGVAVAVSDNGIGLDAEVSARAFDAFFTTKAGGLGMGLAISRSIIEAHRGQLWVESNPDGGATFEFTLPHRLKK